MESEESGLGGVRGWADPKFWSWRRVLGRIKHSGHLPWAGYDVWGRFVGWSSLRACLTSRLLI